MASNMILDLHSDASYMSEPDSKSRASCHFYPSKNKDGIFNNRAVMTLYKTIKHVLASAAEAETSALFYN